MIVLPAMNKIWLEIGGAKAGAQDSIRRRYLKKLAKHTGNDTLVMSTGFTVDVGPGAKAPGNAFQISHQDVQGFMSALHGLKGKALDIIVHSPGGVPEATEQIVNYVRSKYDSVRIIVPQNAMSAATMLACAADRIIMGKHSALGPIDPQIGFMTDGGKPFRAPAQSILDEFDRAKTELTNDPQSAPIWVRRMDKYPIGFLKMCDNAIALSQAVVAKWLTDYMLKDDADGANKANAIAKWLGDANSHMTHGRPIGIAEARAHGLLVDALEDDDDLQEHVLSVFHACQATHAMTNCPKFIENQDGKGFFLSINVPA